MTELAPRAFAIAAALAVGCWAGSASGDVQAVYTQQCAFCHGEKGGGDGAAASMLQPKPTNFARAEYWKTADDAKIAKTIREGKPGTAMVPFGSTISDEQIDALVGYLKSFAP